MQISQKQRAYDVLRAMLLNGELAPGDRLSDFTLSKKIGVSRPPIREALGRLESDGLVEQVPSFGTFVRKIEPEELEELFEFREVLESYAAARAAERISDDEIRGLANLERLMHAMVHRARDEKLTQWPREDAGRWIEADLGFHMLVMRAARSRFVTKLVSDLRIMTRLYSRPRADPELNFLGVQVATWRDHFRILRALRRRDPDEARFQMSKHISGARRASAAWHRQHSGSDGKAGDSGMAGQSTYPPEIQKLIEGIERYG